MGTMRIEEVIRVLNEMENEGVIERYAIGGAVAATVYLEPVSTLDVDVFIALRKGEGLITLEPIFAHLARRGCKTEGEYIIIGGWPVQFLPPTGPLVEEGLSQSVQVELGESGQSFRVFTPDYLAAIALETGRAKDKARLLQFLESGVLDERRFRDIVSRHDLDSKWKAFETAFLQGDL
jgi:hypothetical protein